VGRSNIFERESYEAALYLAIREATYMFRRRTFSLTRFNVSDLQKNLDIFLSEKVMSPDNHPGLGRST
jgi:hypothetical protein